MRLNSLHLPLIYHVPKAHRIKNHMAYLGLSIGIEYIISNRQRCTLYSARVIIFWEKKKVTEYNIKFHAIQEIRTLYVLTQFAMGQYLEKFPHLYGRGTWLVLKSLVNPNWDAWSAWSGLLGRQKLRSTWSSVRSHSCHKQFQLAA